jgi:short-subunit dehydrogenase
LKSYEDKTVLVTGASSGIGLAMANSLARRGAHVILTARSTDKLNELAAEIKQTGVNANVFPGDLSEPGAAEQLHDEVTSAGLQVDLLINNAGYGRWGDFDEFERDDYGRMIQLNITSLTDLCHLFIPDMIARGGGGVINVGSVASFIPVPYAAVYSATKAYVLLFSDALRFEYAGRGVSIMTVCPGATDSNFRQVAAPNLSASTGSDGDSSEDVAEESLDAYLQDQAYVITGKGNKKFALLPRLLSRERVLNMVGKNFGKRIGK